MAGTKFHFRMLSIAQIFHYVQCDLDEVKFSAKKRTSEEDKILRPH